ncbi:MAG: acyltransferase [Hyphomonadaceae bacterium]|nr:acyltransferase [Hyphomonadaceae bacterium]
MLDAKAELPPFTGLRGIAALLVLFFHIRTPAGMELTFGPADPFSVFGYLGVDVFFVLSGFILSHVYGQSFSTRLTSENLRSFTVARFARIYPLHVATTILMLLAYAVALRAGVSPTETSGYELQSVVLGLLLLQEWFGTVAPNPGSWSISVELLNYIALPFLLFLAARLPRYWPIPAIIIGALAAQWPVGTNVLHGFAEFVMGCAAYYAAKQSKMKWPVPLAGLFFVIPFLAPYVLPIRGFGLSALCFTATIYFLAQADSRDPFARLCSWRPVIFIGEISYSVYLLQWFVWIGWKHVMARLPFFADHPYIMVLCASASLIALSTVSYYYFEKPTRAWLRRTLDTGPEGAVPALKQP